MAKKEDSLFLLEVLIDKIVFTKSPCFTDKDFRTCVNIQCTTVESLEICDDEPGTNIPKSEGPFIRTFNSGKSCLFSLKDTEINEAMSKFPIKVSVYRSLPCGCLPTKVVMGEATIDMTKEFVQARNKFLEDPNSVSYQALKDAFRIVDKDGAEAGEIIMFLRISCFGKLIVTKFQGTSNGAPNLKGGGSSVPTDRSCVPHRDYQTPQDPCVCGASRRLGASDRTGKSSGPSCTSDPNQLGVCPAARDPYNSMPCEEFDDPCYCSGPKPTIEQKMACRNTDKYCLHVPKDCCPPGNKIIFKMPSDFCGTGHKQRSHLNYTTDGVGDIAREDASQLTPTNAENYPGVVYDLANQVIKMRIAKTIEMAGRKSKLEYQFITPSMTHEKFVPITDTRTAQCVPTCPGCCNTKCDYISCTSLHSPFGQDNLNVAKTEISSSIESSVLNLYQNHIQLEPKKGTTPSVMDYKHSQWLKNPSDISFSKDGTIPTSDTADLFSNTSTCTISAVRSRQRSVSFSKTVDYCWNIRNENSKCSPNNLVKPSDRESRMFGKNETTVYMTLFEESRNLRSSGTQATGSINKCSQLRGNRKYSSSFQNSSYNNYLNTNLLYGRNKIAMQNSIRNPEIYFCGKKCKSKGMGSQNQSVTKILKKDTAVSKSSKKDTGSSRNVAPPTQAKSISSSATMQTKNPKQVSSGTGTLKTVSIKADGQKPCPAVGTIKGDMMVTLSHIKISPKQQCPIHGKDPCQGPKCIAAASQQDGEQAPVKVTNVNNPRRGVFELVIRKMTGAPLAKNELMLEWTPPTCRAPTCSSFNGPYPTTFCKRPTCQLSKYRLMTCQPVPCRQKCVIPCRQKCLKKLCKRSCCQMSLLKCPARPCKKCFKPSCCGRSCSPIQPCLPEPCKSICPNPCISPSIPSTCKSPCPPGPCCVNTCMSTCFSTPCLRPCPIGRKRPRRARSHPRVKQHKKRISPCLNKSNMCPLVRCRSTFIPCDNCCSLRYCIPRKFCLTPCKSLGSCRSYCSTNCE